MANYRDANETERIKNCVMMAAAKLFVTNGYSATSVQQIADAAGIHKSTLMYVFKSKEDMLAMLAQYMLNTQTSAAIHLVEGKTTDPVLLYAAEIALKLYTAEDRDHIRDLYVTAYSLPKPSGIIHQALTERLEKTMAPYLSGLKTKDFFELELAAGGILRSFMTIPCDMYFTMDRKLRRVLESTLLICRVPDEKIQEALAFVSQFDWPTIAQNTIQTTWDYLEHKI